MTSNILEKISDIAMESRQVTCDIILLNFTLVNAFIVGDHNSGQWVLVDTGLKNSAEDIIKVAKEHFGEDNPPQAIILTHGHFDHVGSVIELCKYWNTLVYSHELELPYLTGKDNYPEGDTTVGGGIVSELSPLFPNESIDLGNRIRKLPSDKSVPGMSDWKWIHTPGHTPGHISLFRQKDRVLIPGDAFTTLKQESMLSVLSKNKEVSGPPAYFTMDWNKAEESVKCLADLEPSLVIPSHGLPIQGSELKIHLDYLAQNFKEAAVPEHGKYI
ncbi:MBL fold metallo-hydrolase [Clostridium sp. DJ247]|uniref:MBL fold metallo-hydrolase n=1 Tax=Clostridium sp. DJ247 TaxID=2726188 RepID=UPI001628D110|nr:MBL fold metallo-hydrolase [Clostridium sp. DJ247]MBC2581490.1 MBL fold metallo-hydrolase [Clostridium sp. DJ247]